MNIVHIAWLGAGNYGDDLMREAVLEQAEKRLPGPHQWTIWCSERPPLLPPDTRWIYGGGGRLPLLRRFFEQRALQRADMLLIGGGSVLHSYNSSEWKRRGALAFHQQGKRKVFGIGLGVGPFDSKSDEEACIAFLQELDGCAFRDRASYEFAKASRLPYEPILAFDLATCASAIQNTKAQHASNINHVGVSVRLPYRVDEEKTIKQYVALLESLASRYQKVSLFSFSHDAQQSELKFCEALRAQTNGANISIVSYGGDTASFTASLAECDFHITTKLHGAIVPYLLGIPFMIISYQRKFEDFANDIGLPQEQRFTQATMDVQRILGSIRPFELSGREQSRENALRNFAVIV